MKDQLRIIFDLNQLDARIHQMREDFERIPRRREELEGDLDGKRRAVEEKNRAMNEMEKVKRERERDVESSQARLADFEGKLSQIKTNKEYQAALKEVAELKKMIKAAEDQILDLMNQIEGLKKEKESLEEPLQAAQVAFEKEKADLDQREKEIQQTIGDVERQRGSLMPQIEPVFLSLYQKAKKMREEAISFIENGACQGCNMRIPPQLHIEIQKLKTVHSCPSCHRILYLREWYPQETAEKEAPPL